MAEGFFTPQQLQVPGLAADDLCAALVRILPRTILQLDIVESAEAARAQGRNESMPDGSEHWFRYFTPEDMARCADPGFTAGMVRHEFCELVRAGASFPRTITTSSPTWTAPGLRCVGQGRRPVLPGHRRRATQRRRVWARVAGAGEEQDGGGGTGACGVVAGCRGAGRGLKLARRCVCSPAREFQAATAKRY